jgi:hypothetical protein
VRPEAAPRLLTRKDHQEICTRIGAPSGDDGDLPDAVATMANRKGVSGGTVCRAGQDRDKSHIVTEAG